MVLDDSLEKISTRSSAYKIGLHSLSPFVMELMYKIKISPDNTLPCGAPSFMGTIQYSIFKGQGPSCDEV